MTQGTILSRSRSREIVEARNEAFYHSQKLGKSLPQIGRFYARDHTTVLNGIRRHKQRMEAAE
jgi:chromosomal replication initiation ATPase DnaA